jgi:hypothetical protein
MPEQGRIRMGKKEPVMEGGKQKVDKSGKPMTRPKKLTRFRFTSGDVRAMNKIAELYGGTVEQWADGPTPDLLEVMVDEERIPIVLPPDPLAGTPIYEHWSGGGCLRRCDGVDCTLALADNAGPTAVPAVVPCPCRENDSMLCKPRTRLNVILRDVAFGGTWRLESTGWNAVEELPGQVDMILAVQGAGLSKGELSIAQRTRMVNGRRKQFVVPALSLPDSILEIASGAARLQSMGRVVDAPATLAALPAPIEVDDVEWFDPDTEVADAEIVDEVPGDAMSDPPPKRTGQSPQAKALHAALNELTKYEELARVIDRDTMRHALIRLVTEGRSESSKDISPDEAHRAINLVADLLAGDRRYIGIAEDGRLRISAHKEATA